MNSSSLGRTSSSNSRLFYLTLRVVLATRLPNIDCLFEKMSAILLWLIFCLKVRYSASASLLIINKSNFLVSIKFSLQLAILQYQCPVQVTNLPNPLAISVEQLPCSLDQLMIVLGVRVVWFLLFAVIARSLLSSEQVINVAALSYCLLFVVKTPKKLTLPVLKRTVLFAFTLCLSGVVSSRIIKRQLTAFLPPGG